MKNIIVVLILTCLLGANAWGQGFMKSYDIDGTTLNSSGDILIDNNDVFILSASECYSGYACTGLIKTDTSGTVLWNKVFQNPQGILLPAKSIRNLGNGNYLITGGLGYIGYPWQLFFLHVNSQGDSIKIREYGNIEQTEGGIHTVIKQDTIFSLMSYSNIPITFSHEKLLKMDTSFANISELPISDVFGYDFTYSQALALSSDSTSLYICLRYTNDSPPIFNCLLRKMDFQNTILWTYPMDGVISATNTPGKIRLLQNNNIATYWFQSSTGTAWGYKPYILSLSSEGEFVWKYTFNTNYEKFITDIIVMTNGDIVGCGYSRNPGYNYDCAWLFRLSPEGELLWEREYISTNPVINFLVALSLAKDDQDNIFVTGPIIATSGVGYESNSFLLKVLPNGCFTPDCNGGAEDTLIIASTVVGVENPPKPPQGSAAPLLLYPNPTANVARLLLPNSYLYTNGQVQVSDLNGRLLQNVALPTDTPRQSLVNIPTHDLPNGVYIVSYIENGQLKASAKLTVLH